MPTQEKTFVFYSGTQGWVPEDDTYTISSHTSGGGNPVGCIETAYVGPHIMAGGPDTPRWVLTDTWANIFGAILPPDGFIVNKVRAYTDTRCITYYNMYLCTYGQLGAPSYQAISYKEGGGPTELWAGRAVTAAEGSWTEDSGPGTWTDVGSGYSGPDDEVEFWLTMAFHGFPDGYATLRWDNVKIEIDFDYVMSAASGSYALTGQDVRLGRAVACTTGTYTSVGYATGLLHYDMTIEIGSYAITGNAVNFNYGYAVAADYGSYTLTGYDAELMHLAGILAAQGSYVVTGYDVGVLADHDIGLDQGSYTLTGYAVDGFTGYYMLAEQGSYTLTGYALAFLAEFTIGLDYGSYVVTGDDSDIWKTSHSDLRNIIYDFWLAYDDPSDYDTAGALEPFELPFRVAYMYGFGVGSGGAKHGQASDPVNEREMLILDANDRVVVDTALVESGHETIYYRRTWSSELEIIGWEKKHAVLFVVVFTSPTSGRRGHAILDGRF